VLAHFFVRVVLELLDFVKASTVYHLLSIDIRCTESAVWVLLVRLSNAENVLKGLEGHFDDFRIVHSDKK